jgi:tetratricopeptide (TPR) repeat protein
LQHDEVDSALREAALARNAFEIAGDLHGQVGSLIISARSLAGANSVEDARNLLDRARPLAELSRDLHLQARVRLGIAEVSSPTSMWTEGIAHCETAADNFITSGDYSSARDALTLLGDLEARGDGFDRAVSAYERALLFVDRSDLEFRKVTHGMTELFRRNDKRDANRTKRLLLLKLHGQLSAAGQWANAAKQLQRWIDVPERTPDDPSVGTVSCLLAMALDRAGRTSDAIPFLEKGISELLGDDSPKEAIGALLGLGIMYLEQERHKEARRGFRDMLGIAKRWQDTSAISLAYLWLGCTASDQAKWRRARVLFLRATKAGNLNAVQKADVARGLARSEYKLGRRTAAYRYNRLAVQMIRTLGDPSRVRAVRLQRALMWLQDGNRVRAERHFRIADALAPIGTMPREPREADALSRLNWRLGKELEDRALEGFRTLRTSESFQ